MLELIRKHRTLFSIIFVLSALGMIAGTFGEVSGINFGMGTGVIAEVDDLSIKKTEFDRDFHNQLSRMEDVISSQSQGSNPEQAEMMRQIMKMQVNPDSVLNRMIEARFREVMARKNGVVIGGSRIREALGQIDAFQADGHFDPVAYKKILAANGFRPADFERQIASDLQVQSLQEGLSAGLAVQSDLEFQIEEKLSKRRIFEIAAISAKNIPDPALPSAEALKSFREDLNQKVYFDSYYNEHIEDFRKPAAIKARHILFPDTAEGEKQAKTILADIKAGKISFEEAAKKYSQDKANANEGGDLGFFERGVMDPAFEKAAFALEKPKDLAPVTKSSFGYHLIQLQEKRAASDRPLETVMEEIAPKVWLEVQKKKILKEKLASWISKPQGPTSADLKAFKADWKEVPAWNPLEDRLGPYTGVSSYTTDLLKLNAATPFMPKTIEKSGNWILVKYKKDDTGAKDAFTRETALQKKANEAIGYYYEESFKALDKAKKIVRSEGLIAKYREAYGPQNKK